MSVHKSSLNVKTINLGKLALMPNLKYEFALQQHFGRMFLSLLQTFVMMVGEINYQDNFLKPYLQGDLPFPNLTLAIFIWFVLLVPILLMNLLVSPKENTVWIEYKTTVQYVFLQSNSCILSLDWFGRWWHSRGSDKRMFEEDCNAGDSTQTL